jgi:hypothetical protein
MTYWTILWITFLGGPFDGEVTFLAYPSEQSCLDAQTTVSDTLPYDHNIKCEVSDMPSSLIRPRRNPRYE